MCASIYIIQTFHTVLAKVELDTLPSACVAWWKVAVHTTCICCLLAPQSMAANTAHLEMRGSVGSAFDTLLHTSYTNTYIRTYITPTVGPVLCAPCYSALQHHRASLATLHSLEWQDLHGMCWHITDMSCIQWQGHLGVPLTPIPHTHILQAHWYVSMCAHFQAQLQTLHVFFAM